MHENAAGTFASSTPDLLHLLPPLCLWATRWGRDACWGVGVVLQGVYPIVDRVRATKILTTTSEVSD